jgi:glycosyltransferase involved in cell wall biosynthesis
VISHTSPGDADALVSVVVPTRNSARTLRRCLESIRAQEYPRLEVVVVDNASDDETPRIAAELAEVVLDGGPERSAQRNLAIGRSRGEWILWIDSDMELSATVVSTAVRAARQAGADGVFIPEVSFGPGYWTACRALERRCYVGEPMIESPRLVRRSFFLESGGFRPDVAGQEDAELRMRLLAAGRPLARTDAVIRHDEGRLTLRSVVRKRLYYGRSIPAYAAAQPGAVRAQGLATARALWRRRRLLAAHPATAAGLLALRAIECVAYAAGAAAGWRARRRLARGG